MKLSDGTTLWTASTTKPGAAAAVFVHGGPGMWDYLAPLAHHVSDLVHTHRYDQRGCGRSAPDDDYRVRRFVADLDELREHFGHDRWFVVGHSFGATLALAYAAAHPQRVLGLVYCDGVGLDWTANRAACNALAETRLTPAQVARREELGSRRRSWDEEVEWRTLCWLPDFVDPAMARLDAETPLPINFACNHALNAETHSWTSEYERALCRRVTAPVLALHGSEDPRPLTGVHALVDALPSAELVTIDGAGHQPWRERPDDVRDVLRTFVRRPAGS